MTNAPKRARVKSTKWTRNWRKTAFFSGWLMAALFSFAPVAHAESGQVDVAMTSTVGFAGYFGKNDWVPVNLTIHNIGPAVQADLVLHIHYAIDGSRTADGTLHFPVWLPKGTWVDKKVAVPGMVIDGNTTITCDVGGQPFAVTYLSGNALGNVALTAVLSTQTQSAQFLTGSSNGTSPVLPVSVDPRRFPEAANLLNGLTAVVATPEVLSSMNTNQQTALETWVKLGGMLLVTGTSQRSTSWESFFPMISGKTRTVSGDGLIAFAGESTTGPGNLPIAVHALKANATVWASTDNTPLLASLPVGRGEVWQTSFSPIDLLGWSGNAALWTNVLKEGATQSDSATLPLLDPRGPLSLTAASDALAPLRVPSLDLWLTVFLLYVVLVGPVSFILLRRARREPWAWIILPAFGLVTTLGIYGFGASERPSGMLTAGVGVLDLVGDQAGTAESYGVEAFMSPTRGAQSFSTSDPMLALTLTEKALRQFGSASVVHARGTDVSFVDVGRWGVRYVYEAGSVTQQGQLHANLSASFGMLFGTVRNDTPYPLQNVAMFWRGHMYTLGNLAPGVTVGVNQATAVQSSTGNWINLYSAYNHNIARGLGRPLGTFAASQNWLDTSATGNEVMFVATTSGTTPSTPSLPVVSTNANVASTESIVLVRQFSPVTVYLGGPVS